MSRSPVGPVRVSRAHVPILAAVSALLAVLVVAGCARPPDHPVLVELRSRAPGSARDSAEGKPRALVLSSAYVTRDGASVQSRFVFAAGNERLVVDLSVHADPQPKLRRGTWRLEGPTGDASGSVRAGSIRFLGGQGAPPALGGELYLLDGGEDRYRLSFPPASMKTAATDGEAHGEGGP